MKAIILITGQPQGNLILKSSISGYTKEQKTDFNGWELHFDSKAEAAKAISEANKNLKAEGETSLKYCKNRFLSYDASTAKIINSHK